MENLKKGDTVCVKKIKRVKIPPLARLKIVSIDENSIIVTGAIFLKKNEVFKIGESKMQYKESNRYKLAQAIKKTGFSAKALSRAVVGNESYFYNKTGVARFNKKGDISDETLNVALTDLAFAERELLGIGAKTVDDEQKIIQVDDNFVYDKDAIDKEVNDTLEQLYIPKEKPTSNKPLFIGALTVISIVLILFILNNYLQVV